MTENVKIPLGWDKTNHELKVSYIPENKTVRLNKVGDNNHNFPGPELLVDNIPDLIEALKKIYDDHIND